jgi:predicted permease
MSALPPRLTARLLAWALRRDPAGPAILGDLQEDFAEAARLRGPTSARLWYWREALALTLGRIFWGGSATRLSIALLQDARYAARALKRAPGVALFQALMIALGIGAATSVFSVLQPLLLAPLPFPQAERLVWIANEAADGDASLSAVTSRTANLRDFKERARSFDGITGYNAFYDQATYTLTGTGEPQRLVGAGVAHDFLDVLGVVPLLGRNFDAVEGLRGGPRALILTHGYWMRGFAGDPAVLGRSLTLNERPYTVVGVLPASFDFVSVFRPGSRVDFLLPFPILAAQDGDFQGNVLSMVGRLAPGATPAVAQAELEGILAALQQEDPRRWGLGAVVTPLHRHVAGPFRSALLLLAAASGTLLLIVCVNVSGLILARSTARTREMAVRKVFGAERRRLLSQLVLESVGVSLVGAAVGSLIAAGVTGLVRRSAGISIPLLDEVRVDQDALLFASAVALVCGLLVGLLPALHVVEGSEASALKSSTRTSTAGRTTRHLRELLVFTEVTLACLLLAVGGLLARSFGSLLALDLGFEPESAVAWQLSPGRRFDGVDERTGIEARAEYFRRLAERVAAVPGVERVGLIDGLPLGRNRTWGLTVVGEPAPSEPEDVLFFPHIVDPGYLGAMEIRLVDGRNFSREDVRSAPRVVLINESGARRVFGGADALGQRIRIWTPGEWEVVGVVGDVRDVTPETPAGIQLYFPITQMPDYSSLDLVVRSGLPTEQLVAAVSGALREVDASLPTVESWTLASTVGRSLSARRFTLALLGAFGVAALVLAGLGIYGVLAQVVAERRAEIGIRVALGASSAGIVGRVVGQTLVLAGAGVVAGGLLALAGARLFGSLLFGVRAADPLTFAGMALTLLLVACVAAAVPALRAVRIPGLGALRSD